MLKGPAHPLCYETRDIEVEAGAVERRQIGRAIFLADHRPRIAAGREYGVHEKARRSSVTVRIRMGITKHPVPKYGPHQRLVRFSSRIKHHRHGVHVNDVVSMQVVTAAIENILIYINTLTT